MGQPGGGSVRFQSPNNPPMLHRARRALPLFTHHLDEHGALGWWRLEQEELRGLLAYRGWDPGFWGSSLCKLGRVIFLSTSQFSSLSVGCRWPFPHAWPLDDYRGLGCQWLCDLWGAALMVADISMLRPYKCSFCHCSTSCIGKQCRVGCHQREGAVWCLRLDTCNDNWARGTNSATAQSRETVKCIAPDDGRRPGFRFWRWCFPVIVAWPVCASVCSSVKWV